MKRRERKHQHHPRLWCNESAAWLRRLRSTSCSCAKERSRSMQEAADDKHQLRFKANFGLVFTPLEVKSAVIIAEPHQKERKKKKKRMLLSLTPRAVI